MKSFFVGATKRPRSDDGETTELRKEVAAIKDQLMDLSRIVIDQHQTLTLLKEELWPSRENS